MKASDMITAEDVLNGILSNPPPQSTATKQTFISFGQRQIALMNAARRALGLMQSQPAAPVSTPFPFATPQEITAAAEAFAAQLDNNEPSAAQQRRGIMLALQSATAAQTMRFIVALEREFSSVDKAPQFYTVLRNITRTIEGA